MSEGVRVRNLTKHYGGIRAVESVTLDLPRGTLMALLGPSGCGKSTTLRMIAGLEVPDNGEIWLDGTCAVDARTWLPPERRRVGMVFQDYALFPHLTVDKNVAFPLNGVPAQERRQRIATLLSLVGLQDLGGRYPHQLSGGQQQRVALARALAADPTVVLLDEPFSNLDAVLRKHMRAEVRHILQSAHTTTIFVTHDQEEAFSLADIVAVMQQGRIVQVGTPQMIYMQPVSRAVATFVGDANFLAGDAKGTTVSCALGQLTLALPQTGRVTVLIRPENLILQPDPDGAGQIEQVTFYGYDQVIDLRLRDATELRVRMRPQLDFVCDMRVNLQVQGPVIAYAPEADHG